MKFAINFFFYLGYMCYSAFVLMWFGAEGEVAPWLGLGFRVWARARARARVRARVRFRVRLRVS